MLFGGETVLHESITWLCIPAVSPHFQMFFVNRACTCEIEIMSSMHTLERGAISLSISVFQPWHV